MCTTCGCSESATPTVTDLDSGKTVAVSDGANRHHHHHGDGAHDHDHTHNHGDHHHHAEHDHSHDHGHQPQTQTVALERAILAKNDVLAARNRGWFEGRDILALNLVSSPGSGKTTLLVKTIVDIGARVGISVVEGDQETLNDAERIRAAGCRVVQVNTGTGCHLEADMLARGLQSLQPPPRSVVMIENVGNLVCPALFDLGELCKVAILSVTEGDDKPLKYPHMFRASDLLLINKIDLLDYVDFDIARCAENARRVNPDISVLNVSATTGAGMDAWYDWIVGHLPFRPWDSATDTHGMTAGP